MIIVYATENPPETITSSMFLAGPSPRQKDHPNWRIEALELLEELGYQGVVFIPLPRDGNWAHSYDSQVEWEHTYLHMADKVVFWIPRNMETLPALTTNVEFGIWYRSGKAVLGFPTNAPKMRYLAHHAKAEGVPIHYDLTEMLTAVVANLGEGSTRTGGEREVPLSIWKLPHFQGWYKSQVAAGNRLDGAKLLWTFRVGPTKGFTFAYVLHVDVYIASEGRNKTNEFIFGRPDIATIVAYRQPRFTDDGWTDPEMKEWFEDCPYQGHDHGEGLRGTEIALIREFRSPARTEDGFIREVPGGSSWKPGEDPFATMTHELEEETGLGAEAGFTIDPSRLRKVGVRQLCGTLSVHQAYVFSCELTTEEMAFLKQQAADNVVHGVEEDTERTYVEVHRLGDLLQAKSSDLDWSMVGMILSGILKS